MKSQTAFTLLELLIVLTVLSLLMVIAIPYYKSYIIRANMVDISTTADFFKTEVSNVYIQSQRCATLKDLGLNEKGELSHPYLRQLELYTSTTATCAFSLKFSDKLSKELNNKNLNFEMKDQIGVLNWTCTSNDIAYRFLPKNCKLN